MCVVNGVVLTTKEMKDQDVWDSLISNEQP